MAIAVCLGFGLCTGGTMKKILLLAAAALVISTAACSAQSGGKVDGGSVDGPGSAELLQTTDDLVAQGLLVGNAKPSFGPGDPGKIATVAMAPIPFEDDFVDTPIVVRNNTGVPVRTDSLRIEGWDSAGESLGHKFTWALSPAVLQPGGLGLGTVGTRGDIGGSATFDFFVDPTVIAPRGPMTDLTIDSITNDGEAFVGQVTNSSEFSWTSMNTVHVTCFDAEGAPVDWTDGHINRLDALPNGESETFELRLRDKTCPLFLASSQGHGPSNQPTP